MDTLWVMRQGLVLMGEAGQGCKVGGCTGARKRTDLQTFTFPFRILWQHVHADRHHAWQVLIAFQPATFLGRISQCIAEWYADSALTGAH